MDRLAAGACALVLLSAGAAHAESVVTTKRAPVTAPGQGLVTMTLGLDKGKLAGEKGRTLYAVAELEVVGGDRPDRAPLALSVVLDVSGSMQGEKKLENVVAATRYVSDRLGKDDRISIVAYESKTHEVYSPDGAPDAEAAGRALGKLKPLGGTNMEAGLRLGLERLQGLGIAKAGKRLLLLSDGQANEGIASKEGLAKIAAGVRELGGSVSTFGVGADYNEDLMAAIAEAAGGNYHVIDRGGELAAIFAKEFEELGSIVGSQARLALQLPAGLELVEAFGYPLEEKDGAKRLVLRDLYHGMKTKVVLKLAVTGDAPTKGEAALKTRLQFVDARDASERSVEADTKLTWVKDVKGEEGSRNDRIAAIAEELEGARELDRASRAYAEGKVEEAQKMLQQRLVRNQAVQSTLGASADNLAEQNALLEKAMDRFEAPSASREGKAAVKWLKQGARMSAY